MVGVCKMNYQEAKQQLQDALDNQQTISIPKLKRLLETLEFGNTVQVEKRKKGKPTVIRYKGRRFIADMDSRSISKKNWNRSKKPKGWSPKGREGSA